jgi:hypothetical protein
MTTKPHIGMKRTQADNGHVCWWLYMRLSWDWLCDSERVSIAYNVLVMYCSSSHAADRCMHSLAQVGCALVSELVLGSSV